jgi:hypothetical protein
MYRGMGASSLISISFLINGFDDLAAGTSRGSIVQFRQCNRQMYSVVRHFPRRLREARIPSVVLIQFATLAVSSGCMR